MNVVKCSSSRGATNEATLHRSRILNVFRYTHKPPIDDGTLPGSKVQPLQFNAPARNSPGVAVLPSGSSRSPQPSDKSRGVISWPERPDGSACRPGKSPLLNDFFPCRRPINSARTPIIGVDIKHAPGANHGSNTECRAYQLPNFGESRARSDRCWIDKHFLNGAAPHPREMVLRR